VYQSVEKRETMRDQSFIRTAFAVASFAFALPAYSATCPFDGGGSDSVNDGLVLTRYALGITGAPLVASTRYASLDPLQVKNNIECVGCALDMNGDNAIDTVDTTIIARHLAGFSGNALTNGLALGSGSRPTPSSVQSFLASGCAVGGAINAFTQEGNSFGASAELGVNDDRHLNLRVMGFGGFRLIPEGSYRGRVNIMGGSLNNSIRIGARGVTISGGGAPVDTEAPLNGFGPHLAFGDFSVIGGGLRNQVGTFAAPAGFQTVSGGDSNIAFGAYSTVVGGNGNGARGVASTALGGESNYAGGNYSVVMGRNARVRDATDVGGGDVNGDEGSFVFADSQGASFVSTGPNQFNIRAAGGVRLHESTSQFFGNQTRQMLNLWGTEYGIGVQSNTLYYRSGGQFSWFIGGAHCDGQGCWTPPGGPPGTENMRLTASSLLVNGTVVQSSDRGVKENFANVNPKSILAKVASLPISLWNYKADDNKTQHVGPMAQDFKRLFGVGQDDKTIATVDASGVALAAIQGLHALVKEKDAEIARLKEKAKRVDSLVRDLAAVMKRLGMK
jgi:hypothetical protein